jgi:hypothetical protein
MTEWDTKVMSADWRILGRRHQFRTKTFRQSRSVDSLIDLQEAQDQTTKAFATCLCLVPENKNLSDGLRQDEFPELNAGSVSPMLSPISYQDAWKSLGKRRMYRLPVHPPQSQLKPPVSTKIFTKKSETETERNTQKSKSQDLCNCTVASDGKIKLTPSLGTPHISTLYFLAEMERYKPVNQPAQ